MKRRGHILVRWLVAVVSVFTVTACTPSEGVADREEGPSPEPAMRPATRPAAEPFALATYNVNGWLGNARQTAETLAELDADLICCQETSPEFEDVYRLHLADRYPHMRFLHHGATGGMAILAQAPFETVRHVPTAQGPYGGWVVRTRLGGRELEVAAVHLAVIGFREGEGLWDLLERKKKVEQRQLEELRAVMEALSKDVPAVVLGDFGGTADMPARQHLSEHGFQDSFAAVTSHPESHATWRSRPGQWPAAYRVDAIYTTGELRTRSSRVVEAEGSAHRPVVSMLTWRSTDAARDEPFAMNASTRAAGLRPRTRP